MNLYPLIADRLEREPGVVLAHALATCEAWSRGGYAPEARLLLWQRLLREAQAGPSGLNALLRLLRDEGESARRIKDFAPFASILTREERREAFRTCVYDH